MRTLAIGLAAIALLAGCGGSSPSQPAGSIQVAMTEYKFDPSTITAPHGKVTFWLVDSGSVAHDLVIRDSSGNRLAASELVSAGDSAAFTVNDIAAGTYSFFCDQSGHEALGMKGTLTVT